MSSLVVKSSDGNIASASAATRAVGDLATSESADPATIVVTGESKAHALRSEDPFKRGDSIGRYVVLGKIGQGGMGLVYSAYDPDLSRRVAIKVLRDKAVPGSTQGASKQGLLLREAQAMAQLSHPNVLPVYDVGTVHGRVFIATEYVEGQTLKEWLRAQSRSWREVIRVFVAAGTGLAAAHRASLIHRDFKPQNVMIGQDGAVRVMDFGLARLSAGSDEPHRISNGPEEHEETTGRAVLGDSFTMAGTVMGTPAYMAPEQHAGQPLGPAADQYAFCVALFEALYGTRPFVAAKGVSLARAKERMSIQPTPETATPGWLKRILVRGFSADPDLRWPSMDALLQAIQRDPWRRARRVTVGAILTLAAGSGLAAAHMKSQAPEPCGGANEHVRNVWNDQVRDKIRVTFSATRLPYADDSATRLFSLVDVYANDWADVRTTTCRATQVHREQSEIVMDRKMACLDESLDQVSLYLQALSDSSTEQAINRAPIEFPRLASLELCKDADALARQDEIEIPPGEEPAVETLGEATRKLNALTAAGMSEAVDQEIVHVEQLMADVSHPPTRVKALWSLHKGYYLRDRLDDRDRVLPEIVTLSAQYDDKTSLSKAWTSRLWTVAVEQRRFEAARELVSVAETAARLARDEPNADELLGLMNNTVGAFEMSAGNLAAAEDRYRWTCDQCDPVATLNNLSVVLIYRDKTDEARKSLDEAQKHLEGSSKLDPAYADIFLNRGLTHHWEGDLDLARQWYERAVELAVSSIGEDRPKTWLYRLYLGHVLTDLGAWARARPQLQQALNGFVGAYGEGFEFAFHARTQQVRLALGEGNVTDARAAMDELLADLQKVGIDEISLGYVHPLEVDGAIALAEQDWDRAEASFAHALEFYRSLYEPRSLEFTEPLLGLAEVHLARGQLAEAQRKIAEAMALQAEKGATNDLRLARALELRGRLSAHARRREGASEDIQQALDIWKRTAPDHPHTARLRSGMLVP